jgi:hypothetical protein
LTWKKSHVPTIDFTSNGSKVGKWQVHIIMKQEAGVLNTFEKTKSYTLAFTFLQQKDINNLIFALLKHPIANQLISLNNFDLGFVPCYAKPTC